jgi:hypothetical protein
LVNEISLYYGARSKNIKKLQISIPEIEKFLLHRLENKSMNGYNTQSFQAENNINLIVRHYIIVPFPISSK